MAVARTSYPTTGIDASAMLLPLAGFSRRFDVSGSEIKRVKRGRVESHFPDDSTLPPVTPPMFCALDGESIAEDGDQPLPSENDAPKTRYSSYLRPLNGYIDGWILDHSAPDEAVRVSIFIDDIEIATLPADRERPHLKKKFDIISTCHGFRVLVPNKFRDGALHLISLAVVNSVYRRDAREKFQLPPTEVAPYLDVVAISEGTIDGCIYYGDGLDSPEIWFGETALSSNDYSVAWGPSGQASRAFRVQLHSYSAEDLLIKRALISVAHGAASGHAVMLSHFVQPRVARLSRNAISVGAAIQFPSLDRARCRLELCKSINFCENSFSLSIDLSLGVNEVPLPADFHDDLCWVRLLIVGGPSPVELLAATPVPAFSEVSTPAAEGSMTPAGAGLIYAYIPSEPTLGQGQQQVRDRGLHITSSDGGGSEARLTVSSDGSATSPFLRLDTLEAGPETKLRFVFSGTDLQAGDLLHVRWIERSSRRQPAKTMQGKTALSFSLDTVVSWKVWEDTIPNRPQWRDHHTIFQLPAVTREMGVELTAPAGCTLDVAGLAVGRIAKTAETLPRVPGNVSRVALADVLSYSVGQPLPAIVPASYRRFGLVTHLDAEAIYGIAWSHESIWRSTQLQLLVDGQMVGFASAEPLGSFDRSVSPGLFSATLPPVIRDGRPHMVDVQFMGTRESLLGVPRTLTVDSKHDGVAWLTPEGDISGWAADLDEEAGPVQVEISIDGYPIGRILADAQHPMFSDPAHNNGRCSFDFAIPLKFRDDRLHTITVRTEGGVELSGSPILAKIQKGRSTLHIDATLNGWIKGWVVTRHPPATTSDVSVTVNGEFFGTIRAERALDGGGVGGARFRFSFRLPSYAAKVLLSAPELGVEVELEVVRVGHLENLRPSVSFATSTSQLFTEAKLALLAAPARHIDPDWYFAKYPFAAVEVASGMCDDAVQHWLAIGAKRGWSPNPWFDERWYLAQNPDAAAAVATGQVEAGYLHWLAIGAAEWRKPGHVFNPIEYRRTHPRPDNTSVQETALEVVHEWLANLAERQHTGNFPLQRAETPTPPAVRRSLFRRAVTSRLDRTTVFDAHVGRLLNDLRVNAYSKLEELRRTLDDNEVEIVRSVMDFEGLDEPLVSIIMPTFNRAYVIAEGIQSVLDQFWQNWELIVCDDGSFDKTPKIVRQFTDPRIRYLQLEKSNGAVARNFGIKFARGDYIAFLDSDNIWHPLFLTLAINSLRASSRPAAYTGYIDTNSNAVRYTEAVAKFTPFDYLALVAKNYIDLNSLVVRRDLFAVLGTFDEALPRVQDWDLVLRLLRYLDPIEVRCAIVLYRRNPSWGQVTDLAAHTDYTKVVRQRALDRLRGRADIDATAQAQAQAVDLYTGGSPVTLGTSMAFAELLSNVTNVNFVLPSSMAARRFPSHSDLDGRIRQVRLHPQGRLSNHLAGAILFIPESIEESELAGVPLGHPIVEFGWERERLVIRDRRNAGDPGLTLGALRLHTPFESDELRHLDAPSLERESTAAILTIAPMRQRWIRALSRRRDKLQATLYWHQDDQLHALQVSDEQTKPESFNIADGIKDIERHSTILLAAGTGEDKLISTSLGIAAQRDGQVLVVGRDELFESWANAKCAHLAPDDPDAAADLLIKVLDDNAAGERIKVRARRLFDYLYRSDVLKARLRIALSLLNRAAGE